MLIRHRLRLLFGFLLFFGLFVSNVSANCGLQGCPCAVGRIEPGQEKWFVQPLLKYVDFDLDEHKGHYTMFAANAHYYGVPGWIFGGMASLVGLDDGEDSHTGAGNPVVFAEYRLAHSAEGMLSLGTQLELPFGDDEHGIASDHTELIPYASLEKKTGGFLWDATAGFRTALGHEDEHEHDHLFVNPHSEKEILYRVAVTPQQKGAAFVPSLFVDGQHVVKGEDEGIGYLTAGATAGFPLSKDHGLEATFEIPVTSPRRFEWKVGLNMNLRI